ncbi:hypothetical protein AA15669_0205 [Saccharibacter floricola DSM 15669]|uniref:Uncharacterized protein n=1 Tax=Saccharibacter floricola DSM 15669 TaxID=1123227 RepID=A0ABQ0NW91_9PROT|nr:hypothetical protein AA15669_0205 [Saccharibacter floricola DSM 15669]
MWKPEVQNAQLAVLVLAEVLYHGYVNGTSKEGVFLIENNILAS